MVVFSHLSLQPLLPCTRSQQYFTTATMRSFDHFERELPLSLYRDVLHLLAANSKLGPVHMIPGQLIAPGQLTDPEVNFASVHGLTPVNVHMSFSLPRGNFESGLPVVQHRLTRLAEVTFLHVNRTQKLPRGKSSLAHAHF